MCDAEVPTPFYYECVGFHKDLMHVNNLQVTQGLEPGRVDFEFVKQDHAIFPTCLINILDSGMILNSPTQP